jgi:hypothetical protein
MGRIQIPEPLHTLRGHCEIHCVASCCGLAAFDFSAQHMALWFHDQGLQTAFLALTQLETLMADVSRHRAKVVSELDDLSTVWNTPKECITFLESWFREALNALVSVREDTLINPSWRSSTVVALARSIRKERAFDRLPILGDALEDAGCTDQEILAHCRIAESHIRGCWAVDLLLAKK